MQDESKSKVHAPGEHAAPTTPELRDPVCGMKVEADAPLRHEHRGVTYRLCGVSCLAKFRADPERYLAAGRAPGAEPMTPGPMSPAPGGATRAGAAAAAAAPHPHAAHARAVPGATLSIQWCAPRRSSELSFWRSTPTPKPSLPWKSPTKFRSEKI